MSLIGKFAQAHEGAIGAATCLLVPESNARVLLTASLDGHIKAWQVEPTDTGASVEPCSFLPPTFPEPHPLGIIKLAATLDKNGAHWICSNSMEGASVNVNVLKKTTLSFAGAIPCSPIDCWAMACIPSPFQVIVGSSSGRLQIYRPHSLEPWKTTEPSTVFLKCQFIHDIAVRPASGSTSYDLIAVGTESGAIYLVRTGDEPAVHGTLTEHVKATRRVVFSSNGDRLYSAGEDNRINIYSRQDSDNYAFDCTLTGHGSWILALATRPDRENGLLASGSADGQVRVWDVANKTCLHVFSNHTDQVLSLCFLPVKQDHGSEDGPLWLASVGGDRDILVYSIPS